MCRASHAEHRSVPGNQGTNDAEPASNTEQDAIINCKLSYSQKDVRYEKQAKNGNKQAIRSHRSDQQYSTKDRPTKEEEPKC